MQATREPLGTLETRETMALAGVVGLVVLLVIPEQRVMPETRETMVQAVTVEPLVVQVTPEIPERLATLVQAAAVVVVGVGVHTILRLPPQVLFNPPL